MIVTRFAPSPTGSLHVGGLRTALYNYVWAKKNGGKFILRIEDTDRARSTDDSLTGIVRDLQWAGIVWDEGPSYKHNDLRENQIGNSGPYFQSQRLDIYNKYIEEMRAAGFAYEKDGAIVFAMPKKDITVKDLILGDVVFPASQCQDLVIRKSDGFPTFHFAVVIDDATMGITDVIRGQEHLQNCWKHISLQQALGLPTPRYAHIPLIMNPDGAKMSKRQKTGQVNTIDFRRDGYLPEVMLNYLALLGWAPGNDIEEFDLNFMLKHFDVKDIGKGNARFDYKKLAKFNHNALNKKTIRELDNELVKYDRDFHEGRFFSTLLNRGLDMSAFIEMWHSRAKTLREPFDSSGYLLEEISYSQDADKYFTKDDKAVGALVVLMGHFSLIDRHDWTRERIEHAIEKASASMGVSMGRVAQPLRVALTGGTVSPPIDKIACILRKDRTLDRVIKCYRHYDALKPLEATIS